MKMRNLNGFVFFFAIIFILCGYSSSCIRGIASGAYHILVAYKEFNSNFP